MPLHLAGEVSASGVVQIDQRYRAIEEEPAQEGEPGAEEGLSLREGLARAAAARHRAPGRDAERER